MKNVLVPLDILFVPQDRVIAIAQSVPPCRTQFCPVYKPPVPVDGVVELPSGVAGKLGLKVQTEINIKQINRSVFAETE